MNDHYERRKKIKLFEIYKSIIITFNNNPPIFIVYLLFYGLGFGLNTMYYYMFKTDKLSNPSLSHNYQRQSVIVCYVTHINNVPTRLIEPY